MKRIWMLLLSLLFVVSARSQYLVGKAKSDVIKEMKTLYPDFVIDNSTVNKVYKYLKYVDKFGEQTMLVFLSDNDICTATKLISSYANLLLVKNDLAKRYKPDGKDKWSYKTNGVKYQVLLKREEWFFSVFTGKE